MVDKKVANLQLPATNDHTWVLFEALIKKGIAGRLSLKNEGELISRMKKFNDRMIPLLAAFSQRNAKDFGRHLNEKVRMNLQPLIIDIFFDRLDLELEKQMLKEKLK